MKEYAFGEIYVVDSPTAIREVARMAEAGFGEMIKGVVDIEKRIIALNAELHADEEALLMNQGSEQNNLWGINLYPQKFPGDWVEFDSMINIRPKQGNRSRDVEDTSVRDRILEIVKELIV